MKLRAETGQAAVAGLLFTLVFVVLVAGVLDLARLVEYRAWGVRCAEAAALAGVAAGRDFGAYVATGIPQVEPAAAYIGAEQTLLDLLALRGVTPALYDIRVQPAGAGAFAGYPPASAAAWTPDSPGVGVYTEVQVTPIGFGWVTGNTPVTLHIFAAATLAE